MDKTLLAFLKGMSQFERKVLDEVSVLNKEQQNVNSEDLSLGEKKILRSLIHPLYLYNISFNVY